ncbi:hypothetical protein [Flavobacterium sp.]|uniref:hypothetical protein n=1 Tax=Flavobacterium sp. TaxID=239 RepID=UPI001220EA49|nr:hypothetical protein [Flavobacterium sp.]RZJ73220.1 MAG: hypothetical protein EOO49_02630 [Flavobacterium sp.]
MKKCTECERRIVGRQDKKFCSDGCRNVYNNRINKDSNCFMRNVNRLLRRNYRILKEINAHGECTASRKELLNKGFDFGYFTNIRTTKKGKTFYFLYDQGYHNLSDDAFMLVRKPE